MKYAIHIGDHEVSSSHAAFSWDIRRGQYFTVAAPEAPLRSMAADCAQAGVPVHVRCVMAVADFWVHFVDVAQLVLARVPPQGAKGSA